MIDVSAECGWLSTVLRIINVMQMIIQARWVNESPLLILPHMEPHMLYLFKKKRIEAIPELWVLCQRKVEPLASILRPEMDESLIDGVYETLHKLPMLNVDLSLSIGDKDPFLVPKSKWPGLFFLRKLLGQ